MLVDQKALWQCTQPATYEIRATKSCFCPGGLSKVPILRIRNGSGVGSRLDEKSEFLGTNSPFQMETVEGLFAFLDDAFDHGADELDVSFDKTYGYATLHPACIEAMLRRCLFRITRA